MYLCGQMNSNSAESVKSAVSSAWIKDVAQLFKAKLSFIVVLSATLGYLMGPNTPQLVPMLTLAVGGFFLTGASNAFNQIWERDLDKLMKRTADRPIPTGRISVTEAAIIASISTVIGVGSLWFFLNPLSGILGIIAIFFYVFLYTPLKQKSSLAVFVGAFPGAIPPMLGYVAASGSFGIEPGALFATQFMWQFPHFWAIAWVAHEDYSKAGYKLLPFNSGKTKKSAFQIYLYSLFLIPASLLPWAFPAGSPMIGNFGMAVVLSAGVAFAYLAWKLYRSCSDKDAKTLMFASFLYLPIVQIFYVIDKL